jgi:hypothetical protein
VGPSDAAEQPYLRPTMVPFGAESRPRHVWPSAHWLPFPQSTAACAETRAVTRRRLRENMV